MRNPPQTTTLAIIGAGPFGLALAALAKKVGVDFLLYGRVGEFFLRHAPDGMMLRSFVETHIDPTETYTIARYLREHGIAPETAYPIPVTLYREYLDWFFAKHSLTTETNYVSRVTQTSEPGGRKLFRIEDENKGVRYSRSVVIAVGQAYFAHIPPELQNLVPGRFLTHAAHFVDFSGVRDKTLLIIGGRQSAFEWAALAAKSGAKAVHVCLRHAVPIFKNTAIEDWKAYLEVVQQLPQSPRWYRDLSDQKRQEVDAEFYSLGRRHVEAALDPRLYAETIVVEEMTELVRSEQVSEKLKVSLTNQKEILVDKVIAATGYRPDVARIPFLQGREIIERLRCRDGLPELDRRMQSSIPGLYFTSSLAQHYFGPFFNLTLPAPSAAKLVLESVRTDR